MNGDVAVQGIAETQQDGTVTVKIHSIEGGPENVKKFKAELQRISTKYLNTKIDIS
jgi:acylphosphatase